MSHAFDEFTTDVKEEVGNFTTEVADYIDEYFDGVREKFGDGVDLDDFDLPPMDFNFDLDLPEMPEVGLQLQFDGLEIYVQIDTVLSAAATYTLNLYTSQTAIGIRVQDDLMIGVVASIDLILSVEGEIDISSGFHLKLEDGVQVNIGMFAKEVSGLVMYSSSLTHAHMEKPELTSVLATVANSSFCQLPSRALALYSRRYCASVCQLGSK